MYYPQLSKLMLLVQVSQYTQVQVCMWGWYIQLLVVVVLLQVCYATYAMQIQVGNILILVQYNQVYSRYQENSDETKENKILLLRQYKYQSMCTFFKTACSTTTYFILVLLFFFVQNRNIIHLITNIISGSSKLAPQWFRVTQRMSGVNPRVTKQ